MNAAAGNGEQPEVERLRAAVADLQAQRSRLFAEVTRLRDARNEAMAAAANALQEIGRLQARIAELEGNA